MKVDGKPVVGIIHSSGKATCQFSGKKAEGVTVTLANGLVKETFLSFASFSRILKLGGNHADQPKEAGRDVGRERERPVSAG